MPLLGKKVFVRQRPPSDLKPDEELFYCKLTHEVFREYEEFFERVILCNSLVWTCSYTGRPGLTYQECLDSERRARRFLKKFPSPLKRPILFMATLTERGRLNDMCDDVYTFAKDRFFVGESVEVTHYGTTRQCEITRIIIPEKDPKSPVKTEVNGTFKPRRRRCINPSSVKYEVFEKERSTNTVVKAQAICRPKGSYTRERNKLFLKQHARCKNGVWKVKEEIIHKAGLEGAEFGDIFAGGKPSFQSSPTKKKGANSSDKKTHAADKKNLLESGKKSIQGKLNFKKETSEEKKTTDNDQPSATSKAVLNKEEKLKKQAEDEKTRMKEMKMKEKEKRREERRLWTEYMNEWKKPRDDLECDDLKNLPTPIPVECSIPQNVFGDAIMILEFLNTFEKVLNVKNSFPRGFNFDLLQKVLTESDIEGPLNDLVQLLLVAIFQLQDADDEEWKEKERYDDVAIFDYQNVTVSKAMDIACKAVSWPGLYHGTILRKMPLDPFSVTEILRLHLLASGAGERSVYSDQACLPEDPGLWFKIEEPQLVKKLATENVFQFSAEERIKILKVLIHQLLSCSSIHNQVEENHSSLRTLVIQLKHLRAGYSRKLKECTGKSMAGRPPKVKQSESGKIETSNGALNGDMEKMHEDDDDVNDSSLNGDTQKDIADVDSVSGSLAEEQMDEDKLDAENLTPEQIQEKEEKKEKELARLKQDFHRKEREILENIKRHKSFCLLEPVGRDRAYRRYWIFPTVPGIFVEDDDHFVGKCSPVKVIPQISNLFTVLSEDDVPPSYVKKHLQQLNDCRIKASDKENDLKLGLSVVLIDSASPLKVRTDLNPRVDLKKGSLEASQNEEQICLLCKDLSVKDVNSPMVKHCPHIKNIQPVFGVCTFSLDTCPVHNVKSNERTKWAFFYKAEDVESLLLNLNPRGFREAGLRKVLLRDKEKLLNSVLKCPYSSLNISLPAPPQQEVRKSLRKQNIQSSPFANVNPEDALELTFRDTLLDLEENIYVGGLGSLKVPNREAWRISIMQRGYDMQCENLQWGPENLYENGVNGEQNDEADDDISFKSSSVIAKKAVKDMACALLQVSQSIEPKYLTPPLRETESYKTIKQRVLDKIAAWETQKNAKRDCPKIPKSPLERWQKALMECTSFSQLFVHLSTLERSVAWSRSVLKAYCRTCKRKGDAENMLLCDGCDRGHHLYCLKPPLEKIPEGDWFCRVCKPPEKAIVTRKARYTESSDEDESWEESEQEEQCSEEEKEEEEEESEDENETQNTCEICDKEDRHGRPGVLIHCSSCRTAYHKKCLNLSETPKGKWSCRNCQKSRSKAKSASWSLSTRSRDLRTSSNNNCSTSRPAKPQRSKWNVSSKRREIQDLSDTDQSSNTLRNRARLQEKKRARSDSLDGEEISSKRFCRDTAKNNERRRSKSRNGDDSLDYKSCLDLLVELIKHPSSWPFLVPVNKKNAPNYHQIIKRPMDFGTIRTKLNNMSYRNNNDFVLDVYLVLQNCELFNPQSSPEYKAAKTLSKFVASLLKSYNIYNPFDSKGRKALEQCVH